METIPKLVARPERRALNSRVTVLVACADTEKRWRWEEHLQEAFALCEVATRTALEQTMLHLEPHVLLLDLGLPALRSIRHISQVQSLSPLTKIIALASRVDDREGVAALEAGAKGYDRRDIEPGRLRTAVEKVADGEIWIPRRLITVLLDTLRSMKRAPRKQSPPAGPRLQELTPRECQVAELITEGACNKEIARRLNITERTVKAYLTELFRVLKVSDRLQLAMLLNHEGLGLGALARAGSAR